VSSAYDAAVPTRSIALAALAVVLVLAACKDEAPPSSKKETPVAATPPPPPPPPDAAPPPDAPPALPTDPKALAELRKKAILDAKYDEAVKICAAEDVAKIGDQSILSCILAACRQNDVDHAQAWGKLLNGPLKAQAKKICLANKVPL
jgi:hypothetical protein